MGFPEGIPGHASLEGPYKWLQEMLREAGVSFEAEGETTRIHVGSVIVEVKDDPEHGSIVQVQAPLPVPGDNPGVAGESLRLAGEIIARLHGSVYYEVEELAPGYPLLRAIIPYEDEWVLVRDVYEAVASAGSNIINEY